MSDRPSVDRAAARARAVEALGRMALAELLAADRESLNGNVNLEVHCQAGVPREVRVVGRPVIRAERVN